MLVNQAVFGGLGLQDTSAIHPEPSCRVDQWTGSGQTCEAAFYRWKVPTSVAVSRM